MCGVVLQAYLVLEAFSRDNDAFRCVKCFVVFVIVVVIGAIGFRIVVVQDFIIQARFVCSVGFHFFVLFLGELLLFYHCLVSKLATT